MIARDRPATWRFRISPRITSSTTSEGESAAGPGTGDDGPAQASDAPVARQNRTAMIVRLISPSDLPMGLECTSVVDRKRGSSLEQGGDRGCRHRLKDLRAVGCGRGVQGAAVFTHLTCDHAELTTFWAGDTRRPFLQHQHQDQADPAEDQAHQRPADPRAREKAERRASTKQPSALAAAESRIRAT